MSLPPQPDAAVNGKNGAVLNGAVLDGLDAYELPTRKLQTLLQDDTKTPLALVACGSFSPITFLHLRMFEMAMDHAHENTNFEVVGAYLSPVSDAYEKNGLAAAQHRIKMCSIATASSPFIMVDTFEADQPIYTRTALVLDHFHHELNEVRGGVRTKGGERRDVRIVLLAGADLVGTFSTPGLWSQEDKDRILNRYGAMIVERHGTDIDEALKNLQQYKDNIWIIRQQIQNDVSSTKIRGFVNKGLSINYLIPAEVIDYVKQHGLYRQTAASAVPGS